MKFEQSPRLANVHRLNLVTVNRHNVGSVFSVNELLKHDVASLSLADGNLEMAAFSQKIVE